MKVLITSQRQLTRGTKIFARHPGSYSEYEVRNQERHFFFLKPSHKPVPISKTISSQLHFFKIKILTSRRIQSLLTSGAALSESALVTQNFLYCTVHQLCKLRLPSTKPEGIKLESLFIAPVKEDHYRRFLGPDNRELT